ncbi:Rieske 2Fe-2S domain-containing protein [Qingshengfaniella alkalisoli]|uniref:Rieske 2Fe-2S domain-containing protein n=1 Tax=Qingshengfaniella alkalisoli TaxID=2599296 RepID=A0A5B8J2T2_9RHOB|nr:Rieske 2Fe-2S domain-containing protein [Qingshengfaniella alkalisoli]QDY71068.1 Rieske 2Fe-2S domain-containing protein [Qingshengfaniella alkalisoli]
MSQSWTVVSLSSGLRVGGVMRSFVDGQELVIWRSASGRAQAWDNRCPHRGMRLSHGFVRGEQLACLYHGWHYGQDGVCSYIPAHPDLEPPKTICTQIHSCVEADGFVWVGGDVETIPRGFASDMVGVRSIYVDLSVEHLRQRLTSIGSGAQDLVTLKAENGGPPSEAWVALQANGPNQSVMHIGAPAGTDPQACIAISHWAESFRRFGEASETEAA